MASYQPFLDQVEDLTDLELAMLLSLIAQQHIIVTARDDLLDDLASELALIARDIFQLSYIILEREDLQSVDRFGAAILDDDNDDDDDDDELGFKDGDADAESSGALHSKLAGVSFRGSSSGQLERSKLDSRRVVNVIIAKDFNFAHEDVQVQALELIRKHRIYSRTTVHLAPKVFLLLPLVAASSRQIKLNKHLNDRIFMSHSHKPEDGFLNLEELDEAGRSDQDSTYSSSRSPSTRQQDMVASRRIDTKTIEYFRNQGRAAIVTPEIRRYLQDIVAFLRMERGIDGGITPYATTVFLALAKYLAPFHGIDYVTPSLVTLAAKKVYPHRIVIASPKRERSTQYGTDLVTARDLLSDIDPDGVIQTVLDTVGCPT